jgi:hypothetical protein
LIQNARRVRIQIVFFGGAPDQELHDAHEPGICVRVFHSQIHLAQQQVRHFVRNHVILECGMIPEKHDFIQLDVQPGATVLTKGFPGDGGGSESTPHDFGKRHLRRSESFLRYCDQRGRTLASFVSESVQIAVRSVFQRLPYLLIVHPKLLIVLQDIERSVRRRTSGIRRTRHAHGETCKAVSERHQSTFLEALLAVFGAGAALCSPAPFFPAFAVLANSAT